MKPILSLMLVCASVGAIADTGRPMFKEVEGLAFKGDYQAQRNLAYGYSSAPYPGQERSPMLACAWRTVIIRSGSKRVNETDVGNHQVYCDKLDRTSRQAAEAQAVEILVKIAKGAR